MCKCVIWALGCVVAACVVTGCAVVTLLGAATFGTAIRGEYEFCQLGVIIRLPGVSQFL